MIFTLFAFLMQTRITIRIASSFIIGILSSNSSLSVVNFHKNNYEAEEYLACNLSELLNWQIRIVTQF